MNAILQVVKRINKPSTTKSQYNILTTACHEGYQSLLSHTNHNFYMIQSSSGKIWNKVYRPIPHNHYEITEIDINLDIDFILSQDRFGSLQNFLKLQQQTRWPIISLEHTMPQDRWSKYQLNDLKKLCGDINVFITNHSRQAWGYKNAYIISHGIDTTIFKEWTGKDNYVLYVVNELKDRDYFCGFKQWSYIREKVQEANPAIEFKLVGNNGDLGQPAPSVNDLVRAYQNCKCYLNTSQLSPIPMSLMEAMATGCPIITTAKQEIPTIVKNNINGKCSNDLDELVQSILWICNPNRNISDTEQIKEMGKMARKTIEEKYPLKNFINAWNELFNMAYNIPLGAACIRD